MQMTQQHLLVDMSQVASNEENLFLLVGFLLQKFGNLLHS